MQSTLTSPVLWLILIPSVFVFLILVYLATYHLMKKAVYDVTKDAIYDVVYDAISDSLDKKTFGDIARDGDIDFDDLSDKIDKTFKLSKVTYKNVKTLMED